MILAVALPAASAPAQIFVDTFDDDTVAAPWTLLIDDQANLSIAESGGVAGITSTGGGAGNNDALYLSNHPEFLRLQTSIDFSMSIDFRLPRTTDNIPTGQALGLVFGIGADVDGQNSAAIGAGFGDPFGLGNLGVETVGYRVGDAETVNPIGSYNPTADATGTLVIDYVAATDTLTLTSQTSGNSDTLVGLVRGQWNAADVYVSFGARGRGYSTDPTEVYFDNFKLFEGRTVLPEPGMAGALALGGLVLRRRR